MKFQKVLAGMLGLTMIASLTACGSGEATATTDASTKVETTQEDGSETDATQGNPVSFTICTDATLRSTYVEMLVDELNEKSNGRIQGEVLAANSLGNPSDMCQMLQLGTLDIMLSDDMSVDGNLNGALGFAWLPGLVSTEEEADEYYNFGWIADKVSEIMLENNLVRMSSFTNGFRQVGNVVKPISEMSDIKGLKIRTPNVTSVVSFYEKCGALPVMISESEVLSAIQTGTVDGLDNCVYNYINQGVTDVVKYICQLNYCYSGGCFIAGTPFWDTLDDVDKELFLTCAQDVSNQLTDDFRAETDRIIQEGIDNGQWEVTEPSEDMKKELQDIYAQIWEESREIYGDEIMDMIISGDYKSATK